ncbi:DNA repair protein RadA [Streptacidiphilus carbonis]|uniref:DNA repair protein RadA n=1 Tax=Streptacidiphilus carbonis TaxID=105422 RepID=UPI0005A70231|nr:DNA repair protein RadA [Streptacidiphilus carbonis]
MAARTTSTKAPRSSYRCTECGNTPPKWTGRCTECNAWGTIEEYGAPAVRTTAAGPVSTAARPIGQVDATVAASRPTGIGELDRVLGGGLVPGAVALLAGEPGVGKSTLLLDVAAKAASDAHRTLYITAEESTSQVRLRADRIGALSPHLYLAAETDLAAVLGHIEQVQPSLLILDSVQTVASAQLESAPGGPAQIREVTAALIRVSKSRAMSTLLVGHVTKDGSIAGPRLLEHLVDVVLHFEGDRHARLRIIRGVKNRYGATDEVGCFELHDAGISGVADPSGLFLTKRDRPVPGTCLTVTLEGRRPLVAEVQALMVDSQIPSPRRTTSGLESPRIAMVLAVVERHGGVRLGKLDIYTATVGGVKLTEPAADLAIALSVASSAADTPLPANLVAIGEVGLAGEVRRVTGVERRLAEAARLGFTHALVPPDPGKVPKGMRVTEVATIGEALVAIPGRRRAARPAEGVTQ